jgi:beta-lactamase regulating signal transducer with metallopeptidase domain
MIAMSTLIGLALKSVVIAGVTLCALRLLGRRSAAIRSRVAHLGLVALIALPAALLLPAWSVLPVPEVAPFASQAEVVFPPAALDPDVSDVSAAVVPAVSDAGWAADTVAIAGYLLPASLLLLTLLVAIVRLFVMRHRAAVLVETPWLAALAQAQSRMGFKHGTALLVSDELRSPISWGVLRPTIVLHSAAVRASGEAEAIIAHELAHVERWDWAKLLLARLACALFWFNPLVWMLARESHQLREESADDAVVGANIDRMDYAELLVSAARHDNAALLLAAHGVAPGRGSLKRRITRVLDEHLDRRRVGASGSIAGLVLLVGAALPLALLAPATNGDAHVEPAIPLPPVSIEPAVAEPATLPSIAVTQPERRAIGWSESDRREPKPRVRPDGRAPIESLIAARATGVDPAYAARLTTAFRGADLDDVVAARAVGVDAAYAAAMRETFPEADLDDVIGARAAGVSTAYAAEIRRRFPDADLDDLTGMRAVGVTGAFIDETRRSGVAITRARDAITLRAVSGPRGHIPDGGRRGSPEPPAED